MKKTIIIGLILTVIGAIGAFAGFASGASTDLVWDHGIKINKQVHYTKSVKDFKNLSLNLTNCHVEIQTGDAFKVEVRAPQVNRPTIQQTNGTLTLANKADAQSINLGIGDDYPKVIITVPSGTKLDNLSGHVSDDFEITDLTVKNSDLQVDSGHFEAERFTISDKGQITNVSGVIELDSSHLNSTVVNNHNGSVSVEDSTVSGGSFSNENGSQEFENIIFNQNVRIKSNNGKIKIESPTTKGYDLSTNNGNITVFGQNHHNRFLQNESATNKIIVTNDNGSIEVKD